MNKLREVSVLNDDRKGFFHGFFTFADSDGSSAMAVIEFSDGRCDWVSPDKIRFCDPPESPTALCKTCSKYYVCSYSGRNKCPDHIKAIDD